MNFSVYIVGNKIERFCTDAINEYKKRLSRYCKIEVTHVKKPDKLSKKLSGKTHIIMISPTGQQISSEEFAHKINHLGITGTSDVAVICMTSVTGGRGKCHIGDVTLPPSPCHNAGILPCDEVIAISPLEMDEGLTAVVTLEQIYRAFKIIHGETYHK